MIPVAYSVDVVVVGGSTWAVSAAVAAARAGARVFLAAPRSYLGEDLCATLRLQLDDGVVPTTPLGRMLFADGPAARPLHVKRTLDKALLDAGVEFLFGCFPSDVLRDCDGVPCGIAMVNRSGRQAVVARLIIDATDRAWVARLAGARVRGWQGGALKVERTLILPAGAKAVRTVSRQLELTVPDTTFAALARAEQEARDRSYEDGQLRGAEALFYVPPDSIVGRKTEQDWDGPDLAHFRPAGVERFYVLSGSADIPRAIAARLLRPTALMATAAAVGTSAGQEAAVLPEPRNVRIPAEDTPAAPGTMDVKEVLTGIRSVSRDGPVVPSDPRQLPVLGEYDVVVVGGGTSGAAAAIGAARRRARVLVAEYQEGLGGIGTLGLIGKPYHGRKTGFAADVPFPDEQHNIEYKMEWYRREIRTAGGDIWLGVLGCGALVEGGRVCGAVVATPAGRAVVRARVVIDATGNADIAVAAGAEAMYGGLEQGDLALQGVGLPARQLRSNHFNSDYLLVDESDTVDVWRAFAGRRLSMSPNVFDIGTLIQARERRRVVGDHILTYLDQITGRTYPDSIVYSASDYDSHGYPSDPYFALIPHDERSLQANHPAPGGACYTPYRCLLPRGLDNILVIGLGMSMVRDASAMVRMQYDLTNQGYAAGVAAAMAVSAGVSVRDIDVRALQAHLVDIGNLPPDVLKHVDSHPLPLDVVAAAVTTVGNAGASRAGASKALAVVMSHRDEALPFLLRAHAPAAGAPRLVYAKILGVCGRKEGVPELVTALNGVAAWDPKILQGVAAEYAHLPTPIDALILALGRSGDRRALPPILEKVAWLDANVTLSHHRAVALALEQLRCPEAAAPLAGLLAKPGMRGHAMTSLEPLYNRERDKRRRTGALREVVLARALLRCGDVQGTGRAILEEYSRDLRGLFARHARQVLTEADR